MECVVCGLDTFVTDKQGHGACSNCGFFLDDIGLLPKNDKELLLLHEVLRKREQMSLKDAEVYRRLHTMLQERVLAKGEKKSVKTKRKRRKSSKRKRVLVQRRT